MLKKTKIVCTLGPACRDEAVLRAMMTNGMNVARLNFSHQNPIEAVGIIETLKRLRTELDSPLAIMLDTKGPAVRLYGYSQPVPLEKGDTITIESWQGDARIEDAVATGEKHFYTNLVRIPEIAKVGARVLFMDGFVGGVVTGADGNGVTVRLGNGATLRTKAHFSIPKADYRLLFLSDKDREDIRFAVAQGLEYIALSFVSSSADLFAVKRLVYDCDPDSKIRIIAKIENSKAVENLDEIIAHADGIMVARGDLGVELDIEEVPVIQKRIIEKCYISGKPVITATQMLESMIENPIPTRAEASDVANACYDLTSAVMLSGETSIGAFPADVVSTMAKIVGIVEANLDYEQVLKKMQTTYRQTDLTSIVSCNSVNIAYECGAKAIVVVTKSGYSARMISKLRPRMPILAFTYDETVNQQLALNWGVIPFIMEENESFGKTLELIYSVCMKEGFASRGDRVVIVAGLPIGKQGATNLVRVETVGKQSVTGKCLNRKSVSGPVAWISTKNDLETRDIAGKILFLKTFDKEFIPFLKLAAALVMEGNACENDLLLLGLAYNIPVFVNALGIFDVIADGSAVELLGDRDLIMEI